MIRGYVDPIVYLVLGIGVAYLIIGVMLAYYALNAFRILRDSRLIGLMLGFLLLGLSVLIESALSLIYSVERIVYLYSHVAFMHEPLVAVIYNVITLAAYVAFAYSVTNIGIAASPLLLMRLYTNQLMQVITPAIQLYVALMLWINYYKGNSLVVSNALAFTLLFIDNFVLQAMINIVSSFWALLTYFIIRLLGLAFLVNGLIKVNANAGQ